MGGVGAGFTLTTGVIVAAALGLALVSALWWLYFDVAAIPARRPLIRSTGIERARLARDAYSYLHLPMIAGIVLFAFGLKTTIRHVGETLPRSPQLRCAVARLSTCSPTSPSSSERPAESSGRTIGAIVLLALIAAAIAIPALAALALVSTVCSLVVAYEAIRYRASRVEVRHPDLAG
jgi:low temperature requirement protein LtrA